MFYVQVDKNNRVFAISDLAGEVNQEDMIRIDSFDYSLLGKYYNPETGFFEEVTATADKTIIAADGVDTATIIACVPTMLSEITFFHTDTDEPIAVVPVDPKTHTANLQITATTPGAICIRAGELTITKLNEVVITAQ